MFSRLLEVRIRALLEWIRGRSGRAAAPTPEVAREAAPAVSHARRVSGPALMLYEFLDGRFADRIVLTFADLEDVMGCALPERARVHETWWKGAEAGVSGPNYADAWILASRSATPNLSARTVLFERLA